MGLIDGTNLDRYEFRWATPDRTCDRIRMEGVSNDLTYLAFDLEFVRLCIYLLRVLVVSALSI